MSWSRFSIENYSPENEQEESDFSDFELEDNTEGYEDEESEFSDFELEDNTEGYEDEESEFSDFESEEDTDDSEDTIEEDEQRLQIEAAISYFKDEYFNYNGNDEMIRNAMLVNEEDTKQEIDPEEEKEIVKIINESDFQVYCDDAGIKKKGIDKIRQTLREDGYPIVPDGDPGKAASPKQPTRIQLTKEEQNELFKRALDGEADAKQDLIESCKALVMDVALKEGKWRELTFDEKVRIGMRVLEYDVFKEDSAEKKEIGLAKQYDPSKGTKFSTYVYDQIQFQLWHQNRIMCRGKRLLNDSQKQVLRIQEDYYKRYGTMPSPEVIAIRYYGEKRRKEIEQDFKQTQKKEQEQQKKQEKEEQKPTTLNGILCKELEEMHKKPAENASEEEVCEAFDLVMWEKDTEQSREHKINQINNWLKEIHNIREMSLDYSSSENEQGDRRKTLGAQLSAQEDTVEAQNDTSGNRIHGLLTEGTPLPLTEFESLTLSDLMNPVDDYTIDENTADENTADENAADENTVDENTVDKVFLQEHLAELKSGFRKLAKYMRLCGEDKEADKTFAKAFNADQLNTYFTSASS